ncbi:hypothetical protein ACWERW_41620, partial [Streptomyces sp. NPDC004012]
MKMVVQAKLLPSAEEALRLPATLHTCNKGADLASRVAFDKREFSKLGLQKLFPGSPGTGGARGFAHHHGGALPRYVFRGPATGPLASGPGMTVAPCRRHDLGG